MIAQIRRMPTPWDSLKTEVSEERISIIREERIGELGTLTLNERQQ
jgi:hypothetical protein